MKGRLLLVILFLCFNFIAISEKAYPVEIPGANALGVGISVNLKYGYSSYYFNYQSKAFMLKDQGGLLFRLDGYRITKYILPEVTRGRAEVYYMLPGKEDSFYLRARLGGSLFFDVTDVYEPAGGFSVAPEAGFDLIFMTERHFLQSEQTLTFYADGLWLEIAPEYGFSLTDCFSIHSRWNTVLALTYNGNFSIGLYPSLFAVFHFR